MQVRLDYSALLWHAAPPGEGRYEQGERHAGEDQQGRLQNVFAEHPAIQARDEVGADQQRHRKDMIVGFYPGSRR